MRKRVELARRGCWELVLPGHKNPTASFVAHDMNQTYILCYHSMLASFFEKIIEK